jgi:hypothetical protein
MSFPPERVRAVAGLRSLIASFAVMPILVCIGLLTLPQAVITVLFIGLVLSSVAGLLVRAVLIAFMTQPGRGG